MSKVETVRAGWLRPSWKYCRGAEWKSYESAQLEMLESIRNVCESVRDSQMLQCDVAHAIKDLAKSVRGLRRDLKRKGIL